jgi:hypothetical protein
MAGNLSAPRPRRFARGEGKAPHQTGEDFSTWPPRGFRYTSRVGMLFFFLQSMTFRRGSSSLQVKALFIKIHLLQAQHQSIGIPSQVEGRTPLVETPGLFHSRAQGLNHIPATGSFRG